jgi:hypothetical protein
MTVAGIPAAPGPAEGRLPRNPFDGPAQTLKATAMTSRISHTSFDALNAYEQSDEPSHEECLITSRDRRERLLFITVPGSKLVKNRVHLDLRPVDRTREEETERIIALGATQVADYRRPDGSGWIRARQPGR